MLRSVVCFTGWVFPAVVESESAASDAALNDTYFAAQSGAFSSSAWHLEAYRIEFHPLPRPVSGERRSAGADVLCTT